MDDKLFGIGFWQTLIGDTGAGIVAAAIVTFIARLGFSRWRRPKLVMHFAASAADEHQLTPTKDGGAEASFTLVFRNEHKIVSLKSTIYWHLLLPAHVSVMVRPIGDAHVHASVDEAEAIDGVRHVTGHIDKPLYISSALQVPFHFILKSPDAEPFDIGYWFSTEYGKIPAIAEHLERDFDRFYEKMPKLRLRMPEAVEAE